MTAVNTNDLIISLHRKPLQTGCPVLTGWWKKYRCMCPSNHVFNCLLITTSSMDYGLGMCSALFCWSASGHVAESIDILTVYARHNAS